MRARAVGAVGAMNAGPIGIRRGKGASGKLGLVLSGHCPCLLLAGNDGGRGPRSPACDRGQFAATVLAARGAPTARCASAYTLYGSHPARIGTHRSSCSRSNAPPESDRLTMGCYTIRAYRRGRTCPRADYEVWAKAGDHASSAAEGSGVTIGIRYRISERALGGRSAERRRSGSSLRRIVGSAPV